MEKHLEQLLAEFEELRLEQIRPLTEESLLKQINFAASKIDRLIIYYSTLQEDTDNLWGRIGSFMRRTMRNMIRYSHSHNIEEIDTIVNKSNIRAYKDGNVISIFDYDEIRSTNTLMSDLFPYLKTMTKHVLQSEKVDKISIEQFIQKYPNHNYFYARNAGKVTLNDIKQALNKLGYDW